jgi:hypothetical protein
MDDEFGTHELCDINRPYICSLCRINEGYKSMRKYYLMAIERDKNKSNDSYDDTTIELNNINSSNINTSDEEMTMDENYFHIDYTHIKQIYNVYHEYSLTHPHMKAIILLKMIMELYKVINSK